MQGQTPRVREKQTVCKKIQQALDQCLQAGKLSRQEASTARLLVQIMDDTESINV